MAETAELVADLFALDRTVEALADALARQAMDPSSARRFRALSSRATRRALLERSGIAIEAPLRAGLARWLAAFVVARVTAPDAERHAHVLREPVAVVDLGTARRVSFSEARRGALASTSAVEGQAWLEAWESSARPVGDAARRWIERRDEVLRRLDLEPDGLAPLPHADLDTAADHVLDATEDLWRHHLAHAPRHDDGRTPLVGIHLALARTRGEGWPARLSARWLRDGVARQLDVSRLDPGPLPEALGAASFGRALDAFGRALHGSLGREARVPFGLRADPHPIEAHTLGAAYAALLVSHPFHRRVLGLDRRAAAGHVHALAVTMLVEARQRAAAWLLRRSARRFEELTERALGAPLSPAFEAAWPSPAHDHASRWGAVLLAPALVQRLVEEHDEDWFDNPRAHRALADRAAAPLERPVRAELPQQATLLVHMLESVAA